MAMLKKYISEITDEKHLIQISTRILYVVLKMKFFCEIKEDIDYHNS
jgi:hypothetical protein